MWTMIASLHDCVDCLAPAFTQPSFATCCHLLLGWVMCLGKHTLFGCRRFIRAKQGKNGRRQGVSVAEVDLRAWKREALFTTKKVATPGTAWSRPPSHERQPP